MHKRPYHTPMEAPMTHLTEIIPLRPRPAATPRPLLARLPVHSASLSRPAAQDADGTRARRCPSDACLADLADGTLRPDQVAPGTIRAIAIEMEQARRVATLATRRHDAVCRIDAVTRALARSFRVTGNREHLWRVDTIRAVLRDDLDAHGHARITRAQIAAVLTHFHDDPTRPLRLDQVDGHPVLRGLVATGAAS